MDSQLYPLAGSSSYNSQDGDFLNYWVDQTVEREIIRGKKLQVLKQSRGTKEKYDKIITMSKNRRNHRSKSPTLHKSRRKNRKNSPYRKNSSSKYIRCPLRIAELAVPSKRHCIETWRNNYHVLPGIMIDRLRQQIFDLTPIAKIPEAIECFKRHKYSKRRKNKNATKKKATSYQKCDKSKNRQTLQAEYRYLAAYFGHRISKQLNKSIQITLNSELMKIFDVVSTEIEKLVKKRKKSDIQNVLNRKIHADIAAKITLWISDILEDTNYKILEDQLQDLQEEEGPVLDLIDELVESVVDVCEYTSQMIPTIETYHDDSSLLFNYEEDTVNRNEISNGEKDLEEESQTSSAKDITTTGSNHATDDESEEINIDDIIKNELDNILDTFIVDTVEDKSDIADDNADINISFAVDSEPMKESLDEFITNEIGDIIDRFIENVSKEIDDQSVYKTKPEIVIDNEHNEFLDANDSFPLVSVEPGDLDDGTQANKSTSSLSKESGRVENVNKGKDSETLYEADNDKKVKFFDTNMVTSKIMENKNLNLVFADPNDHLLSHADESWPDEMLLPVLRPSKSVSKSITSLGRIIENEEKMFLDLTDNISLNKKDVLPKASDDAINTETGKILMVETVETTEPFDYSASSNIEKLERNSMSLHNTDMTTTDMRLSMDDHRIIVDIQENSNISESKEVPNIATEVNEQSNKEVKSIIDKDNKEAVIFDVLKVGANLSETTTDIARHRFSIESTFNHHLPTEVVVYDHHLEKISEDDATMLSEFKEIKEIVEIEMDDKETSTSYVFLDNKSTAVSQSLEDIAKYVQEQEVKRFSPLGPKEKVDYVPGNSPPLWVTRHNNEQRYFSPEDQSGIDRNIRMWCKDLENGYENLELWNDWIETTVRNVTFLKYNRAKTRTSNNSRELVMEWLNLQKNVNTDVMTWAVQSKRAQEILKAFRRIYKNFEFSPYSVIGHRFFSENENCNCRR